MEGGRIISMEQECTAAEELARVARLSGLSLEGEEKEILLSDFARITAYMERIAALDTSAVRQEKETDSGSEEQRTGDSGEQGYAGLREDAAQVSGLSEAILAGAPDLEDGMFSVPRTVE